MNETDSLNLTCKADSNPTPNITWERGYDNSNVSFPLNITGKQNEGGYRCTADNGVGNPDNRIVYIFVQCELQHISVTDKYNTQLMQWKLTIIAQACIRYEMVDSQ